MVLKLPMERTRTPTQVLNDVCDREVKGTKLRTIEEQGSMGHY